MKSKEKKLKLENFIFFLAQRDKSCLYAQDGRLHSKTPHADLQSLIEIYNRLFAEENKRFLKEDRKTDARERHRFWAEYAADKKRWPLKGAFYLPRHKTGKKFI